MLEVHIPSVGPEAEGPRQSPEKGHMVFQVEVLCSGRRHTVPRRYSEFHALHKRVRRRRPPTGPGPASVRPLPRPCEIKKLYKVPDFPSKRLPNWRTRGLEQRRQGLEAYIQGILYLNQEVPKELLEFLRLRHFPTDLKASNWGTLGEFLPRESSSQQHQRPVLSFHMDPYVCTPSPEPLPNVVVNGVLQGLYSFSISPDKAQPKAACHPAPLPPMP
ncbi:sorting nexin-22 isoform X1 [Rhinopithecus roxellana]|uniref:sorting nexin-22 isoform X1 n=1 Tax=Rhinopithecus roxellana TaxID=61622 RepID=UPI0012374792|nr:sorting nexin-22 isoform X1 [Rhinopithecus roxellana]